MKEFIIRYWLQVLFSGILGLLTYTVKKITSELKREKEEQRVAFEKEKEEQVLMKLALQAILRDRLIQSYNHHKDKGFCAIHDRDNITNMYNQYHKLGANGVIDSLIDEILKLPVKKD